MSGDYSQDNRPVTWAGGNLVTQGEEIIGAGGSEDMLTVPDSVDWAFAGEFCIELYGVKFDDANERNGLISHYDSIGDHRSWSIAYRGDLDPKRFRILLSSDGTAGGSTTHDVNFTASDGVAYDIGVERDGGDTVRVYVDGSMIGSFSDSTELFNASALLTLLRGTDAAHTHRGRFIAARITAAARYASDGGYTVPSLPLPTQGPA